MLHRANLHIPPDVRQHANEECQPASNYDDDMAFGVRPPALGEWIVILGEAAEFMFDHNIFQDNLVGVDFCEQMVKETNPGVYAKAEKTAAPGANLHGSKTCP